MKQPDLPSKETKPKGIRVRTLLMVLLVMALLVAAGAATVAYFAFSGQERLKRQMQALETQNQQAELERQKATQESKLALARNRQNEVLSEVRKATNTLGLLYRSVAQFEHEVATLKTDTAGKTIALFPELVGQARRFYETDIADLPKASEVITRWESVRRIEQNLLAHAGTAYEPEADVFTSAITVNRWGEDALSKMEKARSIFAGLIRESKARITTEKVTDLSPTLEMAVEQHRQNESLQRQKTIVQATTVAEGTAGETIAAAEARKITEKANVKVAEIMRDAEELVAKQKQEQMLRAAQAGIEASSNKVTTLRAQEEAQKILLRQRATDPKVRGLLAPFLTPGLWQPKAGSRGGEVLALEKKPISLNRLASVGALNPDKEGLDALLHVANFPRDTYRPRWGFGSTTRKQWYENEENLKIVSEAQTLLRELGPTLVEMGELEP